MLLILILLHAFGCFGKVDIVLIDELDWDTHTHTAESLSVLKCSDHHKQSSVSIYFTEVKG